MSRKNDHHHHHDHRRTFDTITGGGHYGGGGRMFCISVVGLSGTEKEKGCLGVGKSCLCNRFIRPQADEYNRDHISILSQPDFSGPIVNNEHWLYWGETRKCTDEGFELTFSIVEQTEFVDDACFQPFRSGKTMEPYHKRCAATRLNSAEKLMYICKNQLGIEKEYEQHYLLDGKFNVDGFICVFDVSQIQGRSIERQIELTALILNSLLKTKKPVVLATTKNDEYSERYVREAEKLVNRREFKGLIPLVETSAHDNVNIDLAFWACVQRDWTKGKTKILSYHEAFQRQQDKLVIVNDAYLTLIKSNITDYRSHWNNTYSNLSQSQDFITYCDLFGQESAQQTFKRHVKKLKDEYVCRKIDMYLRRLPKIFSEMLPDLESFGHDRSWPAVQQILHQHPLFDSNFVLNESLSWQEMDDTNETRIPFDLLQTPEAEKSYLDHLKTLMAEDHLRSLRYQFSELLRETSVVPGQPLREIRDQLKGRECVESLPESELKLIYDEYQKILQQDARDQLNELFLERASLFLQFSTGKTLTQEDLAAISHELSKDDRWLTLDLIPQDRQLALIRHLGFLQWPIKEHCSAGQTCVDLNIEAYHASLAKRNTRNPLWNHDLEKIQIKFIVLGLSAYADNLATVVKAMCPSLEQENPRIHYEMETLPSNESLGMFPIRPFANPLQSEAYLCVYSSRTSLEYLLKTLEHSLLADLQYGSLHPNGLPLVLLLACTPDTSAKERNYLREEGTNRAQCLQCAFFDVTSNEPHARFKSDELLRALIFLSESLIRRAEMTNVFGGPNNSLATNHSIPEGALNPEIRILISLMCGDPLSPARFLESLILMDSLTNLNFYPVSDHSFVTDIGFLLSIDDENNDSLSLNNSQQQREIASCYVEFVVTSYHSSYTIKEELFYGNILVYWSKRQASFANMSALASITASLMPIHILALVENELRPSKLSHQLVAKGKELADQLQAHFRISTLGSEMGKCISSFLNYCLQNKHLIEKNLQIATASSNVVGIENQFDPQTIDDCFIGTDPNDANFESILQQQAHINDHCESPSKLLSDSIYEKLPEDQQQLSKIHQQSSSTNKQHSNEFPSSFLVGHQRHKRYSPEDILDSSSSAAVAVSDMRNAQHFFNPIFNSNEPRTATTGEHLLKPSEMIRQRKQQQQHLNNNNHNSDENLNATADKYAVISGWAYHQKQNNSRSPTTVLGSNHNRLPDQWPPTTTSSSLAAAAAAIIQPPIINDENTSSNERSKAPGKIDIKKYNNLSNAIGRLNLHSPLGPTRSTHSTFDDISKSAIFDDSKIHLNKRERIPIKHSSSTKDNDSESEVSDSTNILTNNDQQTSEISILNERIKFNSLKQPSTIGQLRQNSSNNSKNTQNKKSRRITPVPVAPPRLPSSANSSNAVTPTSSGVGKSFTSFSSYDDSINDKSLNTTTVNSSINNQDIFDTNGNDNENKTGMDSGELRRTRWHQFSKLFSLPADNESGISIDDNSIDAASEDTSVSHSINPTAAAAIAASKASGNNNNSNGEKAKFLKSKSIGTFPELDKKSMRKAEKMEKKRMKEEERKQRKSSKENSSRNRSRSKGTHSSLEDFAQPNGNPVPLFIEKCTLFIEQEGLDMEGIYRVPGNRAHVDTLLLKFDENPDINIAELDIPVNAVATALKDFFLKRLPPIFPSDSMTNIANLAKQYTDAGQLSEMRTFIRELPNSNFEILKHMISHFVKITEKSSENSMDSKNLAICWWPTLLQFEFTNMDLFEQKRPHLMNFVQIMIDSYSDLFSINADSEDNLATLSCSADELSSL
uniref:Rho GTPase-activating protein 190-like isoform X2 n=1 Tax=Dermatophagoides pteronyssinus TaxID=6956 RepID=A0A6P6YIW2_DERPT|nr:rho GTPase-activating protein 190-like isoform X2 [Dermatophagoides pteronyssinus]